MIMEPKQINICYFANQIEYSNIALLMSEVKKNAVN